MRSKAVSDRLRRRRLGEFVLCSLLALAACARDPRVQIIAPDGSRRATVRVEIADTESRRELGLMYRQHLDEDAGMLFVFPIASKQNFWMKNTFIPLDMIFAGENGRIVGIVANAEPQSEKFLTVDAPAKYVLEVNGGFCAGHRVVAGDTFKFPGFERRAKDTTAAP